jgi:hypothetical protein
MENVIFNFIFILRTVGNAENICAMGRAENVRMCGFQQMKETNEKKKHRLIMKLENLERSSSQRGYLKSNFETMEFRCKNEILILCWNLTSCLINIFCNKTARHKSNHSVRGATLAKFL